MKRSFMIWLVLCMFVGVWAWGQESATTGSITGTVVDNNGAPLPGATVVATSETGVKRSTVTDVDGTFTIPFVTPGKYTIEASLQGFTNYKAELTVSLGQRVNLGTMSLKLAGEEVITVTETPTVDIVSTTTGANISEELIRSVPVGRTFASVTYISPQVVNSGVGQSNPSIAGATGLENSYIVDGVVITNAAYGALGSYSIVFGSLGTGINFDYVKEVQVKTGGFEAEFGEALGGVVNVITKSGGNTLSGDVFGYFEPEALEASRDHLDLEQVPEVYTTGTQTFDVGFDAGGKLIEDKLFWFAAFDPTWRQITRIAPEGFPLRSEGELTTTRTIYNYAGKLTFNVNPNHILEATVFGDPGRSGKSIQRGDAFLRDSLVNSEEGIHFGGHNQVARWTGMLTSNLLVEAQVANHWDETTETDFADVEEIIDARTSPTVITGGLGFVGADENRVTQFNGKLTYIIPDLAGRHEFKIGGQFQDIEYTHTTDYTGTPQCFQYIDSNQQLQEKCTTTGNLIRIRSASSSFCADFGLDNCVRFDLRRNRVSPNALSVTSDYLNFFAQDSWTIIPQLTLKLGVRWERQALNGGGDLAQNLALSNNWAPRLGFVWDFLNDRKGKIYGYYGLFYEKIPQDATFRSLSSEESIDIFAVAPFNTPAEDWLSVISNLNNQYLAIQYGATPTVWCDGKDIYDKEGNLLGTDEPFCMGVNMKAQYSGEFVLGIERQVWKNLVVAARYQHRWIGRIIEDTQLNTATDIFVNGQTPDGLPVDFGTFVVTNPSDKYVCTAPYNDPIAGYVTMCSSPGTLFPNPSRNYDSFEFSLAKRFSDNWQVQASYRFARLRGYYAGLFYAEYGQSDPNITALFDFPANDPAMGYTYVDGPLPGERQHIARVYGSYSFSEGLLNGLNLGLGLSLESGVPRAIWGCVFLYGCGMRYITPRGSEGRGDTIFNADLHADYTFRLGSGQRLTIIADAFNIFNRQTPTQWNDNAELEMFEYEESGVPTNPDFQKPTALTRPFSIRFGLRFSW